MSEPRRLSEESGSELELELLRSARHDAPSSGARRKTMVALGLAGSVGATVTATTATSTATTALIKSAGTLALFKWIGAGVIGGLLTIGAVTVAQQSKPPPAAAPPVTAAVPPIPRSVALPVEPRPAETAAPDPGPAPDPEAAPAPPGEAASPSRPAAAPPVSARPAPTSLTDEVVALDAAREALSSGDAARALRALDDHDHRFPGGMLGPEATVLRIEALALRGDRAAAVRLGSAFLDAHPRSPHASRLRSLLGLPAPPDSAP